ncbi:MAG: ABC transporter ATP-binding protein/permease [Anaplasmataceae bacterium]|nr:ABC transporter ATP-binding protein/permease [Anaplasmataceae bacterium]
MQITINYLRQKRKNIALIVFSFIISSIALLSLGYEIKQFIDQNNDIIAIKRSLIFISISTVIWSITLFLRMITYGSLVEKLSLYLRINLYKKIKSFSLYFFEKVRGTEITGVIITDINTIHDILIGSLLSSTRSIFTFIGSIIMLIYTSPTMAFYFILIFPFILVFIIYLGKLVKKSMYNARKELDILSAYVDETYRNINLVKSFCIEKVLSKKFDEHANQNYIYNLKYHHNRALLVIAIIIILMIAMGAMFIAFRSKVIDGSLTIGEVGSFIFYAIMSATSLSNLSDLLSIKDNLKVALNNIDNILNINELRIFEKKNNLSYPPNKFESLVFNKVLYSYPSQPDIRILNDFSFKIKQGEKIAIIGNNGSGKSTIFKLIIRLYNIISGEILINNYMTDTLQLKHLREFFILLESNVLPFSTTIRENLLYANSQLLDNPKKHDDILLSALQRSYALEYILKLENGLDTIIGEQGVKFSSGEMQKILLARAFVTDRQILLLDEPLSALDSQKAHLVLTSLLSLAPKKTILCILHHIQEVPNFDKIIFIYNASTSYIGTHNELYNNNKHYRDLCDNHYHDLKSVAH